jgi:hypothetical protein
MKYSPLVSVNAERTNPVSRFVTVTVAPAIGVFVPNS